MTMATAFRPFLTGESLEPFLTFKGYSSVLGLGLVAQCQGSVLWVGVAEEGRGSGNFLGLFGGLRLRV